MKVKQKKIIVGIGEQQTSSVDGKIPPLLEGITLEKSSKGSGLVVTDLQPNSPAAYTGLRPGDLIVGVNRKRVQDLSDFYDAIKLSERSILLQISRNGRPMYLVVR